MSIYHARLRNKCSDLNNDLYVNYIKEVPTCECGVDVENAEHYFFLNVSGLQSNGSLCLEQPGNFTR